MEKFKKDKKDCLKKSDTLKKELEKLIDFSDTSHDMFFKTLSTFLSRSSYYFGSTPDAEKKFFQEILLLVLYAGHYDSAIHIAIMYRYNIYAGIFLEFAKWFDHFSYRMGRNYIEYKFESPYTKDKDDLQSLHLTEDSKSLGQHYAHIAAIMYQIYELRLEDKSDFIKINWAISACYLRARKLIEAAQFGAEVKDKSKKETDKFHDEGFRNLGNIYYLLGLYHKIGKNDEHDDIINVLLLHRFKLLLDEESEKDIKESRDKSQKEDENDSPNTTLTSKIASLNRNYFTNLLLDEYDLNLSDESNTLLPLLCGLEKEESEKGEIDRKRFISRKNSFYYIRAFSILNKQYDEKIQNCENVTDCHKLWENTKKEVEKAFEELKKMATPNFLLRLYYLWYKSEYDFFEKKNTEPPDEKERDLKCKILWFVFLTFKFQELLAVNLDDLNRNKVSLCYYQSIPNFRKTLENASSPEGCPLLMMHINYMNDPLEGKLLYKILGKDKEELQDKKIYLKSFTLLEDNLPMWERYCGETKGKGVCVKVNNDMFGISAVKLNYNEFFNVKMMRLEDSCNLYRVVYVKRDSEDTHEITKITSHPKEDEVEKKLREDKVKKALNFITQQFKNIEQTMEGLGLDDMKKISYNSILDYYLSRISYLIKADDFESEDELRILSFDTEDKEILPSDFIPRFAAKWSTPLTFDKIIFGPNLSDSEIAELTPYIYDKVEKSNKWSTNIEHKFELTKSSISLNN